MLLAAEASMEDETYASVACKGQSQLAKLFLSRLARLIDSGGLNTFVVLSSKWQEPRERQNVCSFGCFEAREQGELPGGGSKKV